MVWRLPSPPSEGARSGSTGPTWVSFPSLQARSFSLQGWELIDLPLRASMTKIEAGVTVEGARQRPAEDRRVCSGLESDAAGLRSRRLHELTDGIE